MGMHDWAAICSVKCIQYDGYKDTLRVYCYWKCNGWRYNMSPVYGYVYRAGEGEICVANGISVNFQNNQGQYELGYHDYVINRGQSNIHSTFGAHIHSASSYISGDKWSGEVGYDTGALASYRITYNANGGSGAPGDQIRWYGSTINLSGTRPTRTGYTFKGWATSPSGGVTYQPGQSFGGDYNLNLYAVWQVNTWTVSYNANGGINAPASQIKTYGQTLKLSTTKPTKVDYNFKGWATSKDNADKGIVAYAAGANYTSNANITLYAVWELAYVRPRINNLSIVRCNSAGTNSESGTYLKINFSWATDLTGVYIYAQYKKQTDTKWQQTTLLSNGSSKSGSINNKVIGGNAITAESSWVARIYMYDSKHTGDSDDYYTYSTEISVGTTKYPIDIRKAGKGIAFGKVAETDNLADFDFKTRFRNGIELKTPDGIKSFLDAVYPVGSIYMSVKSTNPGTLFGGTWVAIAQGRCLVGVNTSDNDFKTPEKTGGSKSHIHSTANHTLTVNEMPNHNHDFDAIGRVLYWDSGLPGMGGLTSGTTVQYTWASATKYVGGGQAHNHGNTGSASNLNPYLTCYIWKRTA